MQRVHRTLGLFIATLLASAGCRSSAPLAGTWDNDGCFGTDFVPQGIESCSTTLVFTDDLEMSLEAEWVSLPATADLPGCITNKAVTGQSWSTRSRADYDVLTISAGGTATTRRTGCVYPEDNMDRQEAFDIEIPVGDVNYRIRDGQLAILTSDLSGTYSP